MSDILEIEVIDSVGLVIRIGMKAIEPSISGGQVAHKYGGEDILITDRNKFLAGLKEALEVEDDDGTTLIHKMIDEAADYMLENGAEGIEIVEPDEDEDEDNE